MIRYAFVVHESLTDVVNMMRERRPGPLHHVVGSVTENDLVVIKMMNPRPDLVLTGSVRTRIAMRWGSKWALIADDILAPDALHDFASHIKYMHEKFNIPHSFYLDMVYGNENFKAYLRQCPVRYMQYEKDHWPRLDHKYLKNIAVHQQRRSSADPKFLKLVEGLFKDNPESALFTLYYSGLDMDAYSNHVRRLVESGDEEFLNSNGLQLYLVRMEIAPEWIPETAPALIKWRALSEKKKPARVSYARR